MLYPLLTVGAGMAINDRASQEQKETYLPKFYTGEWSGTMCLTEPHSGLIWALSRPKLNRMTDGSAITSPAPKSLLPVVSMT